MLIFIPNTFIQRKNYKVYQMIIKFTCDCSTNIANVYVENN